MLNPFADFVWKWDAAAGVSPATSIPLMYPWFAAAGATAWTTGPDNLPYYEISSTPGVSQFAWRLYNSTDWIYHTLNIRFKLFGAATNTTPEVNSISTGITISLGNGAKGAQIGFLQAWREVYNPNADSTEWVEVNSVGVWDGVGDVEDLDSWICVTEYDWTTPGLIEIAFNTTAVEIYATHEQTFASDATALITVDYADLPGAVAEYIAFGVLTPSTFNSALSINMFEWNLHAYCVPQPAWTVDAIGGIKAYSFTSDSSLIARPFITAPTTLTQLVTAINSTLIAAGWTTGWVGSSGIAGNPIDNGPYRIYRIGGTLNYWLYLYVVAGTNFLEAHLFDTSWAPLWTNFWANVGLLLNETHSTAVRMHVHPSQQFFVAATSTSLHITSYGEEIAGVHPGFMLVDVGETISPNIVDIQPCMIIADNDQVNAGVPSGYSKGQDTNWHDMHANYPNDAFNIGTGAATNYSLDTYHSQPMRVGFVNPLDFFYAVIQSNQLPSELPELYNPAVPVTYITAYQMYQYHMGTTTVDSAANREIRFLPKNILQTAYGTPGAIYRDKSTNIWIRSFASPETVALFDNLPFVIGDFGSTLAIV